jgi:hypothetical protein
MTEPDGDDVLRVMAGAFWLVIAMVTMGYIHAFTGLAWPYAFAVGLVAGPATLAGVYVAMYIAGTVAVTVYRRVSKP